jgi:hypothetical protein
MRKFVKDVWDNPFFWIAFAIVIAWLIIKGLGWVADLLDGRKPESTKPGKQSE